MSTSMFTCTYKTHNNEWGIIGKVDEEAFDTAHFVEKLGKIKVCS